MDASNIVSLLGGVAMFLFGMSVMGDGLKRVAGNKLEVILWRLSSTPWKGVLLGLGVTAAIQSSGAVTVMVIGFVNVGIMSLAQAATVIYGANIGTTVTAQLVALGMFGGHGISTTVLFSAFAGIGAFVMMFSNGNKPAASWRVSACCLSVSASCRAPWMNSPPWIL